MTDKILYFDCFSGISGDMTVGALIDLGVDGNEVIRQISLLDLHGYRIEITNGIKNGISGTDFNVILESDHHHHHEHHHHHHSRNLSDIMKLINDSALDEKVKDLSGKMFRIIAEAEAKIHGKNINDVHFHEVGAVDSIVDIVGAAVCFNLLGADRVISSPLNLGEGTVECAHGVFPVPAPATSEILKGVPVYSSGIKQEMTTPTGAAVIKTVAEDFSSFPPMKIIKTGYGLGKRNLDVPNVLRVVLGESGLSGKVYMIETNIDDMNPEINSYLMPQLFSEGVLDAFISPVIMKKGRPGSKISVLCRQEDISRIEEIILSETSTFGTRRYEVERTELERETENINTPYGKINVKKGFRKGRLLKYSPEYEDCAEAARKQGVPLRKIYEAVTARLKNTED